MSPNLAAILYLVSAILFILSIRGLSSPESARRGNALGMIGMAITVLTTIALIVPSFGAWILIFLGVGIGGGIGTFAARKVPMTDMPQMVAIFNSLVGLSAVFISAAALYSPVAFEIMGPDGIKTNSLIEMSLGLIIGAITFSGSVIAAAKLQGTMTGSPIVFPMQHPLNAALGVLLLLLMIVFVASSSPTAFWMITILAFLVGILIVIPIGGADMPVVISMLNSYSGWAAAGVGFTLSNTALIVTGALVGASGAILSYIMCKGMNRSFISVMLGGFGGDDEEGANRQIETRPVKQGSAEDAAFIMKNAGSVIIVPGYGMAVAQAQHAVKEMADMLKDQGVKVSYAIHPVAGRMPGHMNVLLAEASVPYDEVFSQEDINSEFARTDVAFVIGANDVTNPAARTDKTSPLYGMPVLDVEKANTVLFSKRGMGSGYSGVENELFFRDNTMMLFSDAKKMVEEIVKAL